MRLIDAEEAMNYVKQKKYARKVLAHNILFVRCKEVEAIPIEWIEKYIDSQDTEELRVLTVMLHTWKLCQEENWEKRTWTRT